MITGANSAFTGGKSAFWWMPVWLGCTLSRCGCSVRNTRGRVRGMFQAMRDKRNVALGVLRTSEPQANELAMEAARAFIETEQS